MNAVHRPRVLAVDDVASNLLALSALLDGRVDLAQASSGHEALEMLANERFDALLVDIQMPVMNGFTLVQRVRALAADMPIIFMTALDDPDCRSRAMALGAVDYFIKPIDGDAFRASVLANARTPDAAVEETARKKTTLTSVLVVHDATRLDAVSEALRARYVVREVATPAEMAAAIEERAYASIVCRVGGSVGVTEVDALLKVSTWRRIPAVFVLGKDASTDDLAFVHNAGAHWVTEHAAAAEIVALVRAVLISDN
jgi:PleD family two-component response regulator